NSTDQIYPWIAARPDGLLSLIWVDRRLDPDNVNFDLFYTNTMDGKAFLPNVRVSSATSFAGFEQNFGDYNGLAVSGDILIPAWCDIRDKGPEIYVARGVLAP